MDDEALLMEIMEARELVDSTEVRSRAVLSPEPAPSASASLVGHNARESKSGLGSKPPQSPLAHSSA